MYHSQSTCDLHWRYQSIRPFSSSVSEKRRNKQATGRCDTRTDADARAAGFALAQGSGLPRLTAL